MRSPPRLEEKQLRHIRMMVRAWRRGPRISARHAAAAHLALYDNGLALRLAPALDPAGLEADREPDDDAQPWAALQTLIHGSDGPDAPLSAAAIERVAQGYRQVAAAYGDRSDPRRAGRFRDAMQAFAAALRRVQPRPSNRIRRRLPIHDTDEVLMAATAYPPPGSTDAEVLYNRLDPFFWAWVAGLRRGRRAWPFRCRVWRRPLFWLGMAVFAATQALILTGLALRAYITGWTPVTNMFETIVFVALLRGLLGMGFTLLLVVARAQARPGSATLAGAILRRRDRGPGGRVARLAGPAAGVLCAGVSQGHPPRGAGAAQQLVAGPPRAVDRRRLRGRRSPAVLGYVASGFYLFGRYAAAASRRPASSWLH